MTLALGCIADDYTGASDLANMLTLLRPAHRGRLLACPTMRWQLPICRCRRGLAQKPLHRGVPRRWRARAKADKWLRARGASQHAVQDLLRRSISTWMPATLSR